MFLRTAGDQLGSLPYGVDDGEELDKVVSDTLLFDLRLDMSGTSGMMSISRARIS
jgi:hypothetical protein